MALEALNTTRSRGRKVRLSPPDFVSPKSNLSCSAECVTTSCCSIGEGGTIEILVVEDEHVIRLHLANHLRDAGYVVHEANHAGEALSHLEANPASRAVITDIEMPGSAMDGLALAAAIAKRWPPCKLIIVSGRASTKEQGLPSGAKVFSKPYLPQETARRLHDWGIAV